MAGLRPRLGVDTDERTIPHEVGWIGTAVHLDKGCYRGQETVARVHNLGRPPRMLVLTHLDGSVSRPTTGAPITAGGRTVGRLGTVVDHVDLGPVALALVKRGLAADTPLVVGVATTGARAKSRRGCDDDRPGLHACGGRCRRWPCGGRPAAWCRAVTCAAPAVPLERRETQALPATTLGHGKVLSGLTNTHSDRSRLHFGPLRYCARGFPHGPRPGEGETNEGCPGAEIQLSAD